MQPTQVGQGLLPPLIEPSHGKLVLLVALPGLQATPIVAARVLDLLLAKVYQNPQGGQRIEGTER